MSKKREQEFCTDIVKAIKTAGGYAHKISDVPVSFMKKETGKRIRFTLPKQFDIHATNPMRRGQYTAIEAKMWNRKKLLPTPARAMSLLRPTERAALLDVHLGKGRALVVLKRFVPRASEYWLLSASIFFEHFENHPDLVCLEKADSMEGLLNLILRPWPTKEDQ